MDWGIFAKRTKSVKRDESYLSTVPNFPEMAGTQFSSTSEGQTTQILKSDPKKGVSVVAKMLFPQVDEGFWLYYTSFWYKNI